jgi:hypothetical protein
LFLALLALPSYSAEIARRDSDDFGEEVTMAIRLIRGQYLLEMGTFPLRFLNFFIPKSQDRVGLRQSIAGSM